MVCSCPFFDASLAAGVVGQSLGTDGCEDKGRGPRGNSEEEPSSMPHWIWHRQMTDDEHSGCSNSCTSQDAKVDSAYFEATGPSGYRQNLLVEMVVHGHFDSGAYRRESYGRHTVDVDGNSADGACLRLLGHIDEIQTVVLSTALGARDRNDVFAVHSRLDPAVIDASSASSLSLAAH